MRIIPYLIFISSLSCNVAEIAGVAETALNEKTFQARGNDLGFTHNGAFRFTKITSGSIINNTITVQNYSDTDIEILNGTISGAEIDFDGATAFPGTGGTCSPNLILTPNQSCTIDVEFTPTSVNYYSGSLSIEYMKDGEIRNKTTEIKGESVARILTAATNPVTFTSFTAPGNVTQTANINFSGSGTATLGSESLPTKYSFVGGTYPGTGGNCGNPITANCLLDFNFSTSSAGTFNQRYTLQYDNGLYTDTLSIDLNGTGLTVANLQASPGSHNYGGVATGSTHDQIFTITNNGQTNATTISGAGLAAPFSFSGGSYPGTSGTCGASLVAGGSCNIEITYAPVSPNSNTDTAQLNYNDGIGANTLNISLSGVANTPALIFISSSDPHNYGTTTVTTTVTFTLSNIGSFQASSLTGFLSTGARYGFTGGSFPGTGGTCGTTLAAGANCTINVDYIAGATGTHNDTINIQYNDGFSTQTSTRTVTGTTP